MIHTGFSRKTSSTKQLCSNLLFILTIALVYGSLQVLSLLLNLKNLHKRALRFMMDNYSSSYKRISKNSGKHSIDLKKTKTLNKLQFNLNPNFMTEIFELREQYKLNLHIPRKQQLVFQTKILGSLGPKIWNSMPYHIKSATNLKNPIKKWNGSSCSCTRSALQR